MKKLIPKIFIGLVFLASGGVWLAAELSNGYAFGFEAFAGALLVGFALAFVVGAFCFNSPGYLYFFGVFAAVGVMLILDFYGKEYGILPLTFRRLWVLLVAAPGLGSLIMFFVRKFSITHLRAFLLFVGSAVLLWLGISGICPWGIMVPCIVVLAGAVIIVHVLFRRGKSWDLEQREEYPGEPVDGDTEEDEK